MGARRPFCDRPRAGGAPDRHFPDHQTLSGLHQPGHQLRAGGAVIVAK